MSARPQALATISPEAQGLARKAGTLLARVLGITVEDREQFQGAAEVLRQVKGLQKSLEESRTSVTQPLNQALRQVNDWFKDPAQELAQAETHLKQQMGTFERRERERIAEENRRAAERARIEQEELRRRAAAAERKGQEEKAATLAARAAAVTPKPPETAPVRARGMAFAPAYKFRITNPELVPRNYCQPDESMIGNVVRASKGQIKIPGVEIWEENQVRAGT